MCIVLFNTYFISHTCGLINTFGLDLFRKTKPLACIRRRSVSFLHRVVAEYNNIKLPEGKNYYFQSILYNVRLRENSRDDALSASRFHNKYLPLGTTGTLYITIVVAVDFQTNRIV